MSLHSSPNLTAAFSCHHLLLSIARAACRFCVHCRRARLRRLKFLHHRRKFTEPAAEQYDSQSPSPRSPQHAAHASENFPCTSSCGLIRSPRPPGPAPARGELERRAGPAVQHAACPDHNDASLVAVLHVMRKVFDELVVNALRCQKKRLQEQLAQASIERVSIIHGQGEVRFEGNDRGLSKVISVCVI